MAAQHESTEDAADGHEQDLPPAATPGVDLDSLSAYLDAHVEGGLHGKLRVRLISGGRSNLTYELQDNRRRWVLRRPPLGHVLDTAHDMRRETSVLNALAPTDVPVPQCVTESRDTDVIGAPFYVMDHIDGVVLRRNKQLAAMAPGDTTSVADEMVDILARIHVLDHRTLGLANFARPSGYLTRQIKRWRTQLDSSKSRDIEGFDDLADRLTASMPETQQVGLVHGDYRLDNVLVDTAHPGRVAAVLDWEMATLGDPLADLATLIVFWDGLTGMNNPIAAIPGNHPCFPRRERLIRRYERATSLDLRPLPWYLAFATYRLAAILEGIHYRHSKGMTVGDGFDQLSSMVAPLVSRAHAALDT